MMNSLIPVEVLRRWLKDETRQRGEEGCDVAQATVETEAAGEDGEALMSLYARVERLMPRADWPYVEPDDLAEIRAARPADAIDERIADRLHGGWLGRCAGCALGKPLENQVFMHSAAKLKEYLRIAGAWPLNDFVPHEPDACRAVGLESLECEPSQRGHIRYMESDDDIRYTIMGLDILERRGADFGTRDVARWWLNHLPAAKCFTAEEAAYRNLMIMSASHTPEQLSDEQLEHVRRRFNPYREWIGAQIRADGWGLACPGDPRRAAEFAWRDASLSHVKNGLYGEMYVAAMIAAAAVLDDPVQIVRAGLGQTPRQCRLAEAMRETLARCEALGFDAGRFEELIDWVWRRFGHYDPVHTINNAAAVTAALLLGGRDYEKVITIAVSCGWDTDCNGATAGCICGTMLGAGALPGKWTAPLNDTLLSEIPDFHPSAISALAARHAEVARRLLREV
jgi:ADP-ribosylglycohydrolase